MSERAARDYEPHPILDELRQYAEPTDRSGVTWLARMIRYGVEHTRAAVYNRRRATPQFRAACAVVLGKPAAELFGVDRYPPRVQLQQPRKVRPAPIAAAARSS